jgi:hypothetical protein
MRIRVKDADVADPRRQHSWRGPALKPSHFLIAHNVTDSHGDIAKVVERMVFLLAGQVIYF